MSADSFQAPSLEHLAELLPAYDFEAFIAQGGMGAVYKARQRSLDRDVAIKILPRELGADPEFRQSFETEAKAMARLNYPNLIGVYDFGDVEGMPYIVMEYVNGKSLFHSAYNTAIEPVQAVTIVKAISDGLAHAHENGVIHRDIKPANILLTPKAEPKIGDFGLARPAGSGGSGILMGTPGYAAPEIMRHPDHADRRSDLFALGVILYELLIGRCPPYEYQPPASTVSGCDPALDRICEKAMHPVADLRYQSAEAFSAALDEWLRKATGAAAAAATPAPAGRRVRRVGAMMGGGSSSYEPADSGSGGMVKGLLLTAAAVVIAAVGWNKYQGMETQKAQLQAQANQAAQNAQASKPVADKPQDSALPVKPKAEREKPAESPLKSLERLKSNLAAGKRGEMPSGSIAMNGTDILVVPTPMSWAAATAFAEAHGGHLFVVTGDKDLDKLAALVPAGESGADPGLWLGVGRVGKDGWSSMNGSEWTATSKPVGAGSFAVLDGEGVVKAREAVDRYPFIIQWEKDGSNPASVAAMLRRTGESIAEGKPAFPPGTLSYEGHLIYLAPIEASAKQAEEFAEQAHGHLVILDNEEKNAWLDDKLSSFNSKGAFWIGAKKENDQWKWNKEVPWEFTQWADETQVDGLGTYVKFSPGSGWMTAYRDDFAPGFIVEWTASGASSSGGDAGAPEVPLTLPPAIVELEEKAKSLLANHDKKRQADLAKNAKDFAWQIDTWFGDLSKNEQSTWKEHVGKLKERAQSGRVPEKVTGIRLSERMAKIVEYCSQKQATIDAAFKAEAKKIRDAYVTRVNDAMSKAANEEEKRSLESRIKLSADLDQWLKGVGNAESGVVSRDTLAITDPVVGRWKWIHDEVIDVRADGTVTNEINSMKGTWSLDKGKYVFTWDGGNWVDTLMLSPDGEALTGKNQNGDTISGDRMAAKKPAGSSNPFGTPTMESANVDPIVGPWKWGGGPRATYTFNEDGTVRVGSGRGTWKCVSKAGSKREYRVTWGSQGIVDTVVIQDKKPDYFEGTNSNGLKIWADRIAQ
ncbi:protein kinase domain-containing protein [Luteolibacter luteus]|uniref:Protein kinase n=1 Tax=Luteolibacter luteus TaxID=2728835 RepID=A0A858RK94_9BACT|nr:protein kinase [Luteolibacter luteus]QJE96620.1 protein kinase [Luteolibacter luteus]